MIFSKNESVEDKIICLLILKKHTVKSMRKTLIENDLNITIQGIYKILKSLILDEIILKRGIFYELNEEWRIKLATIFNKQIETLSLTEGDNVRFDLKSLIQLDQQWKNIIVPLQETFLDYPVFIYNPHKIWIHLSNSRKESEENYYKSFLNKKKYLYSIIGGDTTFDKVDKKSIENEYVKIETNDNILKNTDYLIVINDYIIITRISKKLADLIEKYYQENTTTQEFEIRLQNLGIERSKIKLIIERNKEKAIKLRKRMSRDFYISKELKEKFKLF